MDPNVLLQDFRKMFRMYKALAEKAMAQVPTDAAFGAMLDESSNSIAIVVQHIAGNLRSRYRDFLTTDGEKPDRDHDGEFEVHEPVTRSAVMKMWDDGWAVALASLDALSPDDLE